MYPSGVSSFHGKLEICRMIWPTSKRLKDWNYQCKTARSEVFLHTSAYADDTDISRRIDQSIANKTKSMQSPLPPNLLQIHLRYIWCNIAKTYHFCYLPTPKVEMHFHRWLNMKTKWIHNITKDVFCIPYEVKHVLKAKMSQFFYISICIGQKYSLSNGAMEQF